MIKIIKQGRVTENNVTMECTCSYCGCVFSFDYPEDTKIIQVDYNENKRVLECPCCKKHLALIQ